MNDVIKGGTLLAICLIVSKALGALYRIPLTNGLGTEGIGIYQTVFPFYTILLTVSSTGIPNGLAKIIGEGKNPQKVLYKSIIAFGTLGIAGSVVMTLSAKSLSIIQGSPSSYTAYLAIAPSVFFVSLLSCYRGYFQGKNNVLPTGVSQVTEQAIKLLLGLVILKTLKPSGAEGATYLCLAVTASEISALLFMVLYKRQKCLYKPVNGINYDNSGADVNVRDIIKIVLPVTLTALLLPTSRFIDSFIAINFMKKYSDDAIGLYGIYMGAVESIVGLPVALCYGISVTGLPKISKNKTGNDYKKILIYTAVTATLGAITTLAFSDLAIKILYPRFQETEKSVAVNLLRISSLQVLSLPITQACTLVLIGKDKLYAPTVFLGAGVMIKIFTSLFLLAIPSVNIYGMAFSDIACYFVAGFCNLLYIISIEKQRTVFSVISDRIQTKT